MWTNFKKCIIIIIVFESTKVWSVASRRRISPKSRPHLFLKHVKSALVKKNHVPIDYSGFSFTESIPEVELPPPDESSSEEAPLPAEKGELGIPEQYMRVRHGVYKGPVAVFVDSASQEEHRVASVAKNSHHNKQSSSTTTARTPSQTPKTKITTISTTTKKSKTFAKSPATTRKITTTTTKRPLVHTSTPTHVTKKLMSQSLKISTDSALESTMKKTCLYIGSHCRRHNECCTHHCNWRMGLKCDYAIW